MIQVATRPANKLFTFNYLLLCLCQFCVFTASMMIVLSLPLFVDRLGGTATQMGLVIGAVDLTSTPLALASGHLLDLKGRKVVLVIAAAIVTLAIIGFNFAGSVFLLVLLQITRGVGIGLFYPALMTYITDISPRHRRGEALAYSGALMNVGQIIVSPISIFLAMNVGFSAVFMVSTVLILFALTAAIMLPDIRPALTGQPKRTGLGSFISWPVLPPALVWTCISLSAGVTTSFVPLFVTERQLGNAGFFFSVTAISSVLTRAATGKLSDRYGRSAAIVPGILITAMSLAVLAYSSSMNVVLLAGILYGVGNGLSQPAITALAADRAGPGARGAAMATMNASFNVAFATGSIAYGRLLESAGFTFLFLTTGISALVGLAGYLIWSNTKSRTPAEETA